MSTPASLRLRLVVFAAVVIGCAGGIAGYARHAIRQAQATTPAPAQPPVPLAPAAPVPVGGASTPAAASATVAAAAPTPAPSAPAAAVARAAAPPASTARGYLLFRSTALGASYGRVTRAWLDDPDGAREPTPLTCDRVDFAAGSGVCLVADRGALTTYRAELFDARFASRKRLDLAGPPSRARVSPDGRKAAFTVFISGQGYAATFTTRTSIVDAVTGEGIVDDLESWPVTRDGTPFKAIDFNFWGVTFTRDGRRFYATLGTGGKTYLVEGDFAGRRMRVVAPDVECPSLSPDGRRIGFKWRDPANPGGRLAWHVAVLDLSTGRVRVLPGETRSVDDQVAWNGNDELLYAMPPDAQGSSAESDVWAIAADGTAPARRLARNAWSPAVVR